MSEHSPPPAPTADPPSFRQRLTKFGKRALVMELRIYESLWRFVARKPKIGEGATGFRYHRPVLTAIIIFIVLSAVEIPILDLIVHRWPPVRIGVLIIGIWGLTWMIGLFFAYLTRPHTVGSDGIRVREGLELDIAVPWKEFASIARVDHRIDPSDPKRPKGRILDIDGERVCSIRVANETNLEILFEEPTTIRLPGLPPKGGEHTVTRLRFWADDPRGFLSEVRKQLG